MHSSRSNYQNDSYDTYQGGRGSTQRRSSQSQNQPLEHELYPDVTAQQSPYVGNTAYQDYDQSYGRPVGNGYDQRYATQQQPARQQPRRGQAAPSHVARQTAADLGQVDNSQVAGRVAYDEDGNLVVVKKEEKKAPVQMAAIVGSALSAVTSALFSSHIGIGGSLLTVAIGAAVSAAGTQLYTHIIAKSTDKLKNAIDNGPGGQQLVGVMDSSQLDDNGYGYEAEQTVYGYESEEGTPTADGGRIAPQGMIDAASEEHDRQVKRRGIIIVAVMALAAVIVAAGVVTWATQGNGIGTKTPPIVSTATNTANENENANVTATPETPVATTSTNAAGTTDGDQGATAANSAANGSSSSTANQGSTSSSANTNSPSSSAGTSGTGSNASAGSGSSSATNATGTSGAGTSGTSGANASGAGTTGTDTAGSTGTATSGADASANDTASSSSTNSEANGSAPAGSDTTADGAASASE